MVVIVACAVRDCTTVPEQHQGSRHRSGSTARRFRRPCGGSLALCGSDIRLRAWILVRAWKVSRIGPTAAERAWAGLQRESPCRVANVMTALGGADEASDDILNKVTFTALSYTLAASTTGIPRTRNMQIRYSGPSPSMPPGGATLRAPRAGGAAARGQVRPVGAGGARRS